MDGSINFDTKVDTSGFKNQIRDLEKEVRDLNKELASLEKERQIKLKFIQENDEQYNVDKFLLQKDTPLVSQYEKTIEELVDIEDREEEINRTIAEKNRLIEETAQRMAEAKRQSDQMKDNQEKAKQSAHELVKQFTSLGNILKSRIKGMIVRDLINGIQAGFNSLMKFSPQLKSEFNSMKNSLAQLGGSFVAAFEPILSVILPIITKLVSWLNIAITAIAKFFAVLTGRNYINRAIKGQKDYAAAIGATNKQLNKQLAGFDELNNLNDDDTSSGGGGGGSGVEFEKLDMEAEEIARIKAIIESLIPIVAGLLTYIGLIKLGLDSITALGIGVMIAGIVALVQDLIDYIQDPSWENLLKVLMDIGVIIAGLAIAFGAVTGGWAVALTALCALILLFKDDIAKFFVAIGTNIKNWGKEKIEAVKQWWANFKDVIKELCSQLVERVKEDWKHFGEDLKILQTNLKEGLKQLWQKTKDDVVDLALRLKKGVVEKFNALKTGVVNAFNAVKSRIASVWNSIADTVRNKANSVIGYVENMINRVIDGINSFTSGLRKIGNLVTEALGFGSVFGSLSHVSLPRLATGTNYVPQNMIAELHKGEAVVPKAFNESEFNNSERTNELLEQLIEMIGSTQFRAYISASEVGKASVKYIKQQSRLAGESVI